MQGWHSGSHAYSVGCYHYICIYGFPTTFKLRRGIAVPRFVLLLISLWQLEEENNFNYEKVDSFAVGYRHAKLV